MKEQIKVGVYSAPECGVMALDSSTQMCATSGFTEELDKEDGTWL